MCAQVYGKGSKRTCREEKEGKRNWEKEEEGRAGEGKEDVGQKGGGGRVEKESRPGSPATLCCFPYQFLLLEAHHQIKTRRK